MELQALKNAMNQNDSGFSFSGGLKAENSHVEIKDVQTVSQDDDEVRSLVKTYLHLAGTVSMLDEEMLIQNKMAMVDALPDDVRDVSLESMMFITGHFGEIVSALILNHKSCRNLFAEALSGELYLLRESEETRKSVHDKRGLSFPGSEHTIQMGLADWSETISSNLAKRMIESVRDVADTPLGEKTDAVWLTLNQQDVFDIGSIFSNPVYMLIAFNHNPEFVAGVSNLCNDMKVSYGG